MFGTQKLRLAFATSLSLVVLMLPPFLLSSPPAAGALSAMAPVPANNILQQIADTVKSIFTNAQKLRDKLDADSNKFNTAIAGVKTQVAAAIQTAGAIITQEIQGQQDFVTHPMIVSAFRARLITFVHNMDALQNKISSIAGGSPSQVDSFQLIAFLQQAPAPILYPFYRALEKGNGPFSTGLVELVASTTDALELLRPILQPSSSPGVPGPGGTICGYINAHQNEINIALGALRGFEAVLKLASIPMQLIPPEKHYELQAGPAGVILVPPKVSSIVGGGELAEKISEFVGILADRVKDAIDFCHTCDLQEQILQVQLDNNKLLLELSASRR